MKTIDEIITYYKTFDDLLGFTAEALLPYLPADKVAGFLKKGADLSGWEQQPLTREHVLKEMREYMVFAWGKVEDHRGISASRSVEKMAAWLWLLCDEETRAFATDEDNYAPYGAPVLKKICEVYGFPIPESPDIARMAQGLACGEDCMGCGQGLIAM